MIEIDYSYCLATRLKYSNINVKVRTIKEPVLTNECKDIAISANVGLYSTYVVRICTAMAEDRKHSNVMIQAGRHTMTCRGGKVRKVRNWTERLYDWSRIRQALTLFLLQIVIVTSLGCHFVQSMERKPAPTMAGLGTNNGCVCLVPGVNC